MTVRSVNSFCCLCLCVVFCMLFNSILRIYLVCLLFWPLKLKSYSKMKPKSWVWQYANREGDTAYCNLCSEDVNNSFSCRGGTTGSLGRHLQVFHGVRPNASKSKEGNSISPDTKTFSRWMRNTRGKGEPLSEISGTPSSKKPRVRKRLAHAAATPPPRPSQCLEDKEEEIHQALAKMLAINQMPISFCSSEGFLQFMAVLEPNYKPEGEEAIKKRMKRYKRKVANIIKENIGNASGVSCASDCWTSSDQESYMTVTAHFIDVDWEPRSHTLETTEMDNRISTENLVNKMESIFQKYGLGENVMAVVTDNDNVTKAIESMRQGRENLNIACAAHTLQSAVQASISSERIQRLIYKANRVGEHFKHCNVAKYALEQKQLQSGLPIQSLLLSRNRLSSIFLMIQRLIQNRSAVTHLLTDQAVTSSATAAKLEIINTEWKSLEELERILRPIQTLHKVLSTEKSSTSIVRPLIYKLLEKHMLASYIDSDMIHQFKVDFSHNIQEQFHLEWNHTSEISSSQIASLLDPRYKDLEHEDHDARTCIQNKLKLLLTECSDIIKTEAMNATSTVDIKTELELIYNTKGTNKIDIENELDLFFSETQINFDLDPYKWWKHREDKYPTIAIFAKKYLSIPATCANSSAERCSSTAGNIVTFKRSSLLPENVDLSIFLYQNRNCLQDSLS